KQIFTDIKERQIRRRSGETYCRRHSDISEGNRCDMYQIGSMERELATDKRFAFLKDNFETTSCVVEITRTVVNFRSRYRDSAHHNSKHCSWASDLRNRLTTFILTPIDLSLSEFPSRRELGFGADSS